MVFIFITVQRSAKFCLAIEKVSRLKKKKKNDAGMETVTFSNTMVGENVVLAHLLEHTFALLTFTMNYII